MSFALATLLAVAVPDSSVSGYVYPRGDTDRWRFVATERLSTRGGDVVSEVFYRDREGRLIQHERAVFDPETFDLRRFSHEHRPRGASSLIEVEPNGRVTFHWHEGREEQSATLETSDGPLVAGSVVFHLISARAPEMLRGETVELRVLVPERQDTYGLEIQRVEDATFRGQKVAVFEMDLRSAILSWLASTTTFYYDVDQRRIVGFEGRSPPMTKDGDDWDHIDATVIYREVDP